MDPAGHTSDRPEQANEVPHLVFVAMRIMAPPSSLPSVHFLAVLPNPFVQLNPIVLPFDVSSVRRSVRRFNSVPLRKVQELLRAGVSSVWISCAVGGNHPVVLREVSFPREAPFPLIHVDDGNVFVAHRESQF